MYYLIHGQYPTDDITPLDFDIPGCSKSGDGFMNCPSNNTAYNYNGNSSTGQRYEVMGVYLPYIPSHTGRLNYTMVLDRNASTDKGKIFCVVESHQDSAAVKVCESMGGTKIKNTTWQL
jgi:hypothetical protein